MQLHDAFVGTWKLRSCYHDMADGKRFYPFGNNAHGLLVYTAEGYMSGALTATNRKKFTSRELFGGTPEEQASAMGSYLHYAGKYEVKTDHILHHVEMSLFPNWVGTTQKRYYTFEKNLLTLSSGPFIANGISQNAFLLWEKIT